MNLYCIIGISEKKSNLIGLYRSSRWYFLSGSIIKSGLKWSEASFKVARFYDKTWPWDIIYYQAGESSYSQKMKSDWKIGRLEIDFRFKRIFCLILLVIQAVSIRNFTVFLSIVGLKLD